MAASVIGMLQSYAESKENNIHSGGCDDSSLHSVSGSCGDELERATERRACMDGMAGRRADNFIRWCHRCKHEVPGNLETDVCDLCGGEVVEIGVCENGKKEEKKNTHL